MPPPPTLLQLFGQLPGHLNAAHTIANTPPTRHGRQYPAIPIPSGQLDFFQRLILCLNGRHERPADAAVTWSDVKATISVGALLANLVRFIANVAWGPTYRVLRYRALLAAQITVQLTTQLGWIDEHTVYHCQLMCRAVDVIGQLAHRESLHGPLRHLMMMVDQWLHTSRLTLWSHLKRVAVYSVCRVLTCYADRSTHSATAQWRHLNNLSYRILDALTLPRNGPQIVVLILVLLTSPSLLVRKSLHPGVRPKYTSMYAWFASKQPNGRDRDRLIIVCAMHLFAKYNRHRVEAVMLLQLLARFSHEAVVLALPTIQNAARDNPRFMSAAMHGRLIDLGRSLMQHRTQTGLPKSATLSQFRKWVRQEAVVADSPPVPA